MLDLEAGPEARYDAKESVALAFVTALQHAEAIGRFLNNRWDATGRGPAKAIPTRANGQPAFGLYIADPAASILRWTGLIVLTLEGDRIAGLTRFNDSGTAARFGMPRTLPLS